MKLLNSLQLLLLVLFLLHHEKKLADGAALASTYNASDAPRLCTILKAEETCSRIATAHKMSLLQFQAMNPEIDCESDRITIGKQICVTKKPVSKRPNGKIFREYIGALYNGVSFTDVPINSGIEFHFIIAFAIDYTPDGASPTNGHFNIFWDPNLTPGAIKSIKSKNSNVKVMVSLGGDSTPQTSAQFAPDSISSWVKNAVKSLTNLISNYNLDGIDIDYEHFDDGPTPSDFSSCIGQLIKELKNAGTITVASIAPYDDVAPYYDQLWSDHRELIDYVNFQFYTYDGSTTVSQFVQLYGQKVSEYSGGQLLASFSTERGYGSVKPSVVLQASKHLHAQGHLGGMFIWCADASFASNARFRYEQQAQTLLAS